MRFRVQKIVHYAGAIELAMVGADCGSVVVRAMLATSISF